MSGRPRVQTEVACVADTESWHRHSVKFPRYSSSALSFDRINLFQNGPLVFTFSESLFYVLMFSWTNKTFFFWRLSNDCQIVCPATCPAVVSGPFRSPKREAIEQTSDPRTAFLLLLLLFCFFFFFFRFFFLDDLGASCLGHKLKEKKFQYG